MWKQKQGPVSAGEAVPVTGSEVRRGLGSGAGLAGRKVRYSRVTRLQAVEVQAGRKESQGVLGGSHPLGWVPLLNEAFLLRLQSVCEEYTRPQHRVIQRLLLCRSQQWPSRMCCQTLYFIGEEIEASECEVMGSQWESLRRNQWALQCFCLLVSSSEIKR